MSIRIYITDRDQAVLRHVEEFGSITISQCANMFYNEQTYGYDIARKRLNKLCKFERLKMAREYVSNQNVYYMDKKLSYHDLLVMDFYGKLISLGAKIIDFKRNKYWLNGKLVSDGFIAYNLDETLFFNIIEAVRTHAPDLEKYKTLYDSYEAHQACDGIYKAAGGKTSISKFPAIVIIDDVQHRSKFHINEDIDIYQLDFKLNGLSKVFLT